MSRLPAGAETEKRRGCRTPRAGAASGEGPKKESETQTAVAYVEEVVPVFKAIRMWMTRWCGDVSEKRRLTAALQK